MSIITPIELPVGDSIPRNPAPSAATPLTYGLLRQLLLDSGMIDERDAGKLDRAIHRLSWVSEGR